MIILFESKNLVSRFSIIFSKSLITQDAMLIGRQFFGFDLSFVFFQSLLLLNLANLEAKCHLREVKRSRLKSFAIRTSSLDEARFNSLLQILFWSSDFFEFSRLSAFLTSLTFT